ncbi:deoxyribodipyrimidine photo-lyase [Actinoplanes octamycinicus]|uniref:Deoxyribodipyrimidine photo-lyase n=1 Tax=Actinoplanes octamycinicus TaxID=135948 RepID=A0A7W7GU79_9ACTN|nr:deoxyribodipyrimidine photo-lyase [Actinoplanes octamycinicus]MBB4738277.1 deoxyribodipyrimidine photo-lyase [Actinoplanes octamycinicus]GIE59163.1 deoxyribodipyrimidine photo-lyase [Actinoplanes octamycinicus]
MPARIALLTRDLRIHDNPLLSGEGEVVPLFVLDPRLGGLSANRQRFLHQCLADLRATLRERGGDLVIRTGDPVAETVRLAREVGTTTVGVAGDVTDYAQRRERRLRDAGLDLRITPGVTVLPPGAVRPGGGGNSYRVFTPYWKAWERSRWRVPAATPHRIAMPDGIAPGPLPETPAGESPDALPGGETEARRRLRAWSREISRYDEEHDDLAADNTSRLSAYLRFGCLSPLELALMAKADDSPGAQAYLRQLAWRDFYYQVTAAFPKISTQAMRPTADTGWRYDEDALRHWQDGLTGVPIVDAGMRQLRAEGWMHNRARLITAAFLTKHLGIDWRPGLQWFFRWLNDGDVPNNSGNWQWTAGTGNDTRPYRRFNPIRQAQRFDPEGGYVRRYVPELKDIDGGAVHQPWRLPEPVRRGLDYPGPLESHRDEAVWLRD